EPDTDSFRSASGAGIRVTVENSDYAIPSKTPQSQNVEFHSKGAVIEIQGIRIEGGLLYTGRRHWTRYGDPAILDPTLRISQTEQALPLGYWPDYGDLSPAQRGQFLQWLAHGRGETQELGYVFLFFYGLERYVYRDAAQDSP